MCIQSRSEFPRSIEILIQGARHTRARDKQVKKQTDMNRERLNIKKKIMSRNKIDNRYYKNKGRTNNEALSIFK